MYGPSLAAIGAIMALGFWLLGRLSSPQDETYEYGRGIIVTARLFSKICLGLVVLGAVVSIVELLA